MSHLNFAAIGNSFLAILAGFGTMAVLVAVLTALLARFSPSFVGERGKPKTGYLLFNLWYSAIFALAGGYVTALIAKQDPLRHILMLAIIVLLMSALSALQLKGQQPISYQFALIVITPIAALAGGLFRMHQTGYRL